MIAIGELKINGESAVNGVVDILTDGFSISWAMAPNSESQSSFDIRMSAVGSGHGTDALGRDIVDFNNIASTGRIQRINFRRLLARNSILYGQIRLKGSPSTSDWRTFKAKVASLPFIHFGSLIPLFPSPSDSISLEYFRSNSSSNIEIKWYKNGSEQAILRGNTVVSSSLIAPGDLWHAEIYPSNFAGGGPIFVTNEVEVTKPIPTVSQLEILPRDATVDDILEVVYKVSDASGIFNNIEDETLFDWFVNDEMVALSYGKFARLLLSAGDSVSVRAKPALLGFNGSAVMSDRVFIKKSEVTISDLLVDGHRSGGVSYSPSPVVTWNVDSRRTADISGFQVKIGTANGASDYGSFDINAESRSFKIPSNIIRKGTEYYISVIPKTLGGIDYRPNFIIFTTSGSIWADGVSNSNGWTLSIKLAISAIEGELESGYALVCSDGSYTFRIEFYDSLTRVVANSNSVIESLGDNSIPSSFLIGVQDRSLVVYRNGKVIFNIPISLSVASSEKSVRFEPIVSGSEAYIFLYNMFVSVLGRRLPGDAGYGEVSFYQFASFPNSEVSSLANSGGNVIIGVNNNYPDNYPSIYEFNPLAPHIECDLSNFNDADFSVRSLSSSKVGDVIGVGTNRGITIISGGNPNVWDSICETVSQNKLLTSGWSIKADNINQSVSFSDNAIRINTKTEINSPIVPSISNGKVQAISIQQRGVFEVYSFVLGSNTLVATPIPAFIGQVRTLQFILSSTNTIEDLVTEMLSTLASSTSNVNFSYFYNVLVMNEISALPSSFITTMSAANNSTIYELYIASELIDMDGSSDLPVALSSGSKGGAYIVQDSPGTAWYEMTDSENGYLFEIDIEVNSAAEALDSSDDSALSNLSFSDGSYASDIQLFDSMIKIGNKKISFDLSTRKRLRISSKHGQVSVYDMNATSNSPILQFSMDASPADVGEVVRIKSTGIGNEIHAIALVENGNKGNFYYRINRDGQWIDMGKIFFKDGDYGNFDLLAIGSDLFIVFEIAASGRGEIGAARLSSGGWTRPLRITSAIGESKNPRIAVDDLDGIHLVWEDDRNGPNQVMYAYQAGASYEWNSSAFGGNDIALTSPSVDSKNPSIAYADGKIFVVFEEMDIGQSKINIISKDIASGSWSGYAGSGTNVQVSGQEGLLAKTPLVESDLTGTIHVLWTEETSGRRRLMTRRFNASLIFENQPGAITSGTELFDCELESIGLDQDSGDLLVAITKYSPSITGFGIGSDYSLRSDIEYKTFITRFDARIRAWRSSGSAGVARGQAYGGYDIEIVPPGTTGRSMFGACIPRVFKSEYPVIYKCRKDPEKPGKLTARTFKISSDYAGRKFDIGQDPYLSEDDIIFGISKGKYIKIGDYGGVMSADMTIYRIAIYAKAALAPLAISAISPASYNMPVIDSSAIAVSSQKDAWMAGGSRMLFYDSNRDGVFEATSGDFFSYSRLDQYIDSSKNISDIFFDKYGVFYVELETSEGKELLASLGGSLFANITIDESFSKLRIDGSGNAIFVSKDGVRIIKQFSAVLRTSLIEFASAGSEASDDITMPASSLVYAGSFIAVRALSAASGHVYFASNLGLIKYTDDRNVAIFNRQSGIDQSTVRSVAYGMNGRVFCATSTNVYEFVGNSFYKIDPYGYERSQSQISPELEGDIVDISCTESILAIATKQSVYFANEVMGFGVGSIWSSRKLSKSSLDLTKSEAGSGLLRDQLRISDVDIKALGGLSMSIVPEIMLNGHRISRGFGLSIQEKIISLYAPLLPSDKVSVVLRKDISKVVDLKQNASEILAVGKEDRKALEVGIIDGQYGCVVGGSRHHVDIWNSSIFMPHDDIILDRKPPQGKANLSEVVGGNIVKISISPLEEFADNPDPFDEVSGIDKIVVSNYDNFTIDGIIPSLPMPFNREVLHTLNPTVAAGNLLVEIPDGYGTCMASIKFSGSSRSQIAYATGSPASVYISDTALVFNNVPSISFEGGSHDFEVTAMASYQNKLFVAVGRRDGTGNSSLYSSDDGITFTQFAAAGNKITGISISNYDRKMYLSAHNVSSPAALRVGELYSYDNSTLQLVATNLGLRANAVACLDKFVYVGTGDPARIYRYDITSNINEIVMSESETDVTSLAAVGAGMYAGLSGTSRIMRSNRPSSPFVQSFITIPNSVIFGTAFEIDTSTVPYFSVGNILFSYTNAWTAVGRADENIVGACINEFGTIFYVSQNEIKSLGSISSSSLRLVFVKLIDRAGNESEIHSLPDEVPTDGDGYNDNLTIRISSDSTSGQDLLLDMGLSNTIVEYDLDGQHLYTLPGDSPFYSAFRIEEETGIYESPILTGASGHVSWGNITWSGSLPDGTDIEILLRSGATRSALMSAPYSVRFSWPESGSDISFMPGSFIQFQIKMRTATEISPTVNSLIITENAGSTSNVITTMFELPSNMRRGIITTDAQLPSGAAIIAGITLKDATDFAEFQEVPLDRLFEPSSYNNGDKLRIGFKLISPRASDDIGTGLPPNPTDPNIPISINTMQWIYHNELTGVAAVDFKIKFFDSANLSNSIIAVDTISSPQLFKIDGNSFPTDGGAAFASGQTRAMSLIPAGFAFECNISYYVTIEASVNGTDFESILPAKTEFVKQCGANFLDTAGFNYVNRSASGRFHFRISLYSDFARNNLVTSFFSYYYSNGWAADGVSINADGVVISANQSKYIEFMVPNADPLVANQTYYLLIQSYNMDDPGAGFSFSDTSYSLRLRTASNEVSCGPKNNVPVIRGFCMMFELEDGRLVKMRFDG